MVLKTLIGKSNEKMIPGNFTWDQLNKFMTNVGDEEFEYDTFKVSYDNDPAVQSLVKRFDQNGVELKTKAASGDQAAQGQSNNEVEKMAKRATKAAQNA